MERKENSILLRERFEELLGTICHRETSSDPNGWTEENPLWGHCAVVSLLAQDYFGGTLLRVSLAEVPEFAHMRSHYYNALPDGSVVDFTAPQFGGRYPGDLKAEERTRDHILSFPETKQRYILLAGRMKSAIEDTLR